MIKNSGLFLGFAVAVLVSSSSAVHAQELKNTTGVSINLRYDDVKPFKIPTYNGSTIFSLLYKGTKVGEANCQAYDSATFSPYIATQDGPVTREYLFKTRASCQNLVAAVSHNPGKVISVTLNGLDNTVYDATVISAAAK